MTAQPQRRLAAIFVLDVHGFSRMMAADEEGTLDRVLAQQKTVITPEIQRNGGRVIKLMGDGVLAVFPSVISAAEAAGAIQRRVNKVPEPERLTLRIGINLGEVMVADRDVFGDGVNVAARIEALAPPGGVALSAAAYDQVRNRIAYAFEDAGRHRVKNIPDPVQVYYMGAELDRVGMETTMPPRKQAGRGRALRLGIAGLAVVLALVLLAWHGLARAPWEGPEVADPVAEFDPAWPRIAVLPFDVMSIGGQGRVVADGLAQGLAEDVMGIPGLAVLAPDSSLSFQGGAVREAAAQLSADHLITGRLIQQGDLRVELALFDARSGQVATVGTVQQPADDLLALQNALALTLAPHLPVPVPEERRRGLTDKGTRSTEAYGQLVLARGQLRGGNARGGALALELALQADPGFEAAQALQAQQQLHLFTGAPSGLRDRVMDLQGAVAVAPTTAQGARLQSLQRLFDTSAAAAVARAEAGLRKHPGDVGGFALLAWLRHFSTGPEPALAALEIASRLDPMPRAEHAAIRAEILFVAGRDAEALQAADQAIALDPAQARVRLYQAAALANEGRFDAAAAALAPLRALDATLSLTSVAAVLPYDDPAARNRVLTGLQLAGLNGDG